MMKKSVKIGIFLVAALWLALAVFAWVHPARDISLSERRQLAKLPELSKSSLLDGSFMTKFESYTQDQFPFRESFREMKALFHLGILRQGDNNGIYLSHGSAAKLEYPLRERSLNRAAEKFRSVYDTYLQGKANKVLFSVVPDKGYYLASPGGYPSMDYESLFDVFRGLPWAEYVDLTDCLSAESYYRTDTHWRQEAILPAAEKLAAALAAEIPDDLTATEVETPFYGVYRGQAALPMAPDTMYLMENGTLSRCEVDNRDTGLTGSVYDLEKLSGRDPYDVFLSGSVSMLTIRNPSADEDRKLIVFRDSFGSSMVPLLAESYREIVLIDLRYLPSAALGELVDFSGADVLFLYSTLVLNNSESLR